MFKLKLINKPKMIKLKCGFSFPNIVLANLQEKETTPTKEMQQIIADQQYDGLSKVTVKPIPDEYIIPSGEIEINANGNYNVTDKASAKVNVPEKTLTTKTITANGTYNATDDNADGYSQVTVETSGVDINDYYDLTKKNSGGINKYIKQIPLIDTSDYTNMNRMFDGYKSLMTIPQLDTSKVTDMNGMFAGCNSLTTVPQLDTSKVTDMKDMFYGCNSLMTIPQLDTSNVTNMGGMFASCNSLMTIPQLDTSKVTNINSMFWASYSPTNLGGLTNLGQAYSTTQSANYSNYRLDLSLCSNLTHDSLMNVINNLYDIASKGVATQQLVIDSTNLAKLTAEEIQIATSRGWSVS